MPTIDQYSATQDFIRVILQGPPKSGKTVLACQFPRVHVIDLDVNLGGTLRYLRAHNLPLPVSFDSIDRDDDGKEVPMTNRFERVDQCLDRASKNPDIDTIVLDSATMFADIVIAQVLKTQNVKKMSKQEWGFFFTLGKEVMFNIVQMRKHIVLTAHEKINKDPNGAVVFPYEINWPGQMGMIMGAFFTDIWRCEVQEVPLGLKSEYKWNVRTMPNAQYKLGNSFELPPVWQFNWKTIADKLGK